MKPRITTGTLKAIEALAKEAVAQQEPPQQSEELPPLGHPLHTLGERLTHWLDDDQWNNAEPLLLEAYSLCSKSAPQQSAEPVAEVVEAGIEHRPDGRQRMYKALAVLGDLPPVGTKLYAAPPAYDEAVRLLRKAHRAIVKQSRISDLMRDEDAELLNEIDAYLAKVKQ